TAGGGDGGDRHGGAGRRGRRRRDRHPRWAGQPRHPGTGLHRPPLLPRGPRVRPGAAGRPRRDRRPAGAGGVRAADPGTYRHRRWRPRHGPAAARPGRSVPRRPAGDRPRLNPRRERMDLSGRVIAVVGGDEREREIARLAATTGAEVRAYGFPWPEGGIAGVILSDSAAQALAGADYALFPIPGIATDGTLFAPAAP